MGEGESSEPERFFSHVEFDPRSTTTRNSFMWFVDDDEIVSYDYGKGFQIMRT